MIPLLLLKPRALPSRLNRAQSPSVLDRVSRSSSSVAFSSESVRYSLPLPSRSLPPCFRTGRGFSKAPSRKLIPPRNRAACGIATVVVPLHLASVAPPAIAGSIGEHFLFTRLRSTPCWSESADASSPFSPTGILTQISINVGIFAAQAFSSESRPVQYATRLGRRRLTRFLSLSLFRYESRRDGEQSRSRNR